MALRRCRQSPQQLKPQVPSWPAAGAGMGFVHDDEVRRDGQKVLSMPITLDVVEAGDDDAVLVKQIGAVGQRAL